MKNEKLKEYFYWSLTGFGALAMSIVFFFCLYRLEGFVKGLDSVVQILTPFVYGLVMAYLLAPICHYFEITLSKYISKGEKTKLSSFLSIIISLLIALMAVTLFFYLVLPQVWESITTIINNVPSTIDRFYVWIGEFIEKNPEFSSQFQQTIEPYIEDFNTWLRTDFMVNAQKFVTDFSVKIFGLVNVFKNAFIGLIVAIYLLANRTLFMAQGKKAIYGLLKEKTANGIIYQARYANKVFGGFIRGKMLDSFIIGCICFIVCSALKMPYAMLISVIIGLTNIIPFFGPFIGAVPSILLIFTVSPIQGLYFLIFIIILQQFDGNILGPKILGQSVGISGFWILFSILFFGGLWGIVGMVIAVPLFAVIYDIFTRLLNNRLKAKNISTDTKDYENLESIENGSFKPLTK